MGDRVYSATLPPESYDVTDEKVVCGREYTSSLGTFYYGELLHVSDSQIIHDTTGVYGVWNSPGQGGGKVTVVGDEPDSGEVCACRGGVMLISPTVRTVYARYRALCLNPSAGGVAHSFPVFGLMDAASVTVVHRERFLTKHSFSRVSVGVVQAAAGPITFTLASGSESATVSLIAGATAAEADIDLSIGASADLTVSVNANSALVNNPFFNLRT